MANGKSKSKKKLFIFGGLGLLLVILVVVVLTAGSKEDIVLVTTEKVEKRTITQTVAATGTIEPEFKVVITPEVTGEIIELPVKEGDAVRKGQLLIRIKGDQYKAQKEQLEAGLQSAKASLKIREAELQKITSDYNRIKELHAKNLASDSEKETAEANYLTAKASYDAAVANVLQSEARLKEVLESLYKTTIYSPMDGIITSLNVEVGERVLGSGFTQGTEIMTVSDLKNIEAVVEVDENDVILISKGDTAIVKVDAFKDKEFKGVVTQIGNSAKTKGLGTQEQVVNFEVRIKLLNPDDKLRPGMSCTADIQTETVTDVLAVPIQSVTIRSKTPEKPSEEGEEIVEKRSDGKNDKPKEIVFIVADGKAKAVEVTTGISDADYIEIKSGLKGGEDVVSGSYRAISRELQDGSKVRVEEKRKTAVTKK
ncbi:HlyD family secretion protein [Ignavibacterium album JCM 16511]|uniref:HlyD family secretion protein n=1 Tax=Ignavibacterium album (strain DSM 19864 / JCM 16511 / NBRC 101810 / Mat9-16) TaxID=945713 RepID=I0AKA0_IGNAJ|nr:efflux RND transporter periplasmic adaptor subunit [Ignavibacterium album]AFH49407.1 HlyD family secretion protein [Ignavibacterium album JCM 16511]